MAVLGQFWYVIEGGFDNSAPHGDDYSDVRVAYINDDGSNPTTFIDNSVTTKINSGFIEEVVLDTAAGLYYVLTGSDGLEAKLLMGHIGSAAAPTVVFNFDLTPSGNPNSPNNIVHGLHLDPINHVIDVGFVDFVSFDNAHQGIRQFTYNTSTGAVSGGGYIVTQTTANIQPSKAGSTAIFAARDFDIDYTHNALYATVRAQGNGFETNTLVRLNLADPDGSPAVSLINQTLFTTDFAVSPATAQNGFIIDVEVDQASDRVFFVTHDQSPGGAHHEDDAIWVITSASTASGATPTKVTLNGLPNAALFYPEDIVLDEVNNILYIDDERNDGSAGADDDVIHVFQLTSNTTANYIKTITPAAFFGVANIQGMFFDQLAVIANVNGTATHAAEQGVNITLLTGAPTITDFESDHLNNATVQITGGTFSTNESSANDDHLTIAAANRTGNDTSGTINGTNISYSYNTATEKLTLSGYDTLTNYQTALTYVQYFTTGNNPTNYGDNNTRTVSWQANDGAAGDPSGTPNGATTNLRTTTLTIDAQNDGPNIQVLGGGDSASMSLTETNSAFNQSRSLTITDPDSKTETLTLTGFSSTGPTGGLSAGTLQGFFSVPSTANILLNSGSLSFNWTFNSAAEAFNFLAVGETLTLNYTIHAVDSNNSNGPTSVSLSDDQAIFVSIAGTNDAPTVIGGTTQALTAVNEDSAPAGQTVSSLLGSHFSDVDNNATLAAVAIVSNGTSASGKWQWSTNGSTWSDVGTASDASAVLVHAASFLRFLPATNFNGPATALSVRLVDNTQTAFSDGATANVGTNGGTTPYSTGTVSLTQSVTPVNDAPNVADTTQSLTAISEDNTNPAGQTVTAVFNASFSDADDTVAGGSSANNFAGVAVVGSAAIAAQGAWEWFDGLDWQSLQGASAANAILLSISTLIRFVPAANFNGTAPALTVRLVDDSSGAITSGATVDLSAVGSTGDPTQYSAGTVTADQTINSVNDAPTVIGTTATLAAINEDNAAPAGATVASLFGGNFSDATDNQTANGGSAANTLAGIAITANAATATEGVWQYFDGTWHDVVGATTANAILVRASDSLRFVPAANWNGITPALTVHLVDSSGAAIVSGTPADLTTTGGTTRYSAATVALSETVDAVNDAPTVGGAGTETLGAVAEDTTSPSGTTVSTLFGGQFADATDTVSGGSSANLFAGIAITNNAETTQGSWQWFNAGVWTDIPAGNIAANALLLSGGTQLRFLPAADFNGAVPALTVHLVDDSLGGLSSGATVDLTAVGSTGGATRYSSGTVTLDTSVTAVNDAPNVVGGTAVTLAAIDEDNTNPPGATVTTLFSGKFSDADDAVGVPSVDTFSGIAITGNAATTEGTWQYRDGLGGPWTALPAVQANPAFLLATNAELRFVPALNFNGPAPQLTVHLVEDVDGGSPVVTGTTADLTTTGDPTRYSSALTLGQTIDSINDAPTQGANAGLTLNEAATATITATLLDFNDVDHADANITYTLDATTVNGTLWLDANNSGTLNAGEELVAAETFTQADIGANRLRYTHSGTETASDSFQFDVSDGAGGNVLDTTFAITVENLHWQQSIDISPHPAGWVPAGHGDFNADGTTDLAWFNSATGNIDIWKLSNGTWAGSSDVGSHSPGYQPVGFGDYNNDGTDDILWFNPTTRDVDLWKISNGQLGGSVNIGTHPADYDPVISGDFNGDGTSDVLWYNPTTHHVDIWTLDNNGQLAGSVDVGPHPAGYTPALAGDFNGDGTDDVLWYNPTNGHVDIWKMSNGTWAGSVDVGPHPLGWQPLGAADFSQDGTDDVAWHNPTTNNIDIWLLNNGQWTDSVSVGSHPPEGGSLPPQPVAALGVGDFDQNGVADIMWHDTGTDRIDNWLLAFD